MRLSLTECRYKLKNYIYSHFTKAKINNTFSYQLLLDNKDYQVFKRPIGSKKIECAFENVVVLSHKNKISIYPDYRYPSIYYTVNFNNKKFPDLIKGSNIAYCRILPYIRKVKSNHIVRTWRMIVVTDKGQIYHNFPSHAKEFEGTSRLSDIVAFEESVVWDLPGRKYPSRKKDCEIFERYYPGLPDEVYSYHPSPDIKSVYGNEGFPKSIESEGGVLSRFYISRREPQGNPFYYMSGFSVDYKMAILATYRGNLTVGVRTCIFASDDGGRQWFCKYEFGDLGEYNFKQGPSEWGKNFGHQILCNDNVNGSMVLRKRNCIIPSHENKEPGKSFEWGEKESFNITQENGKIVLISKECHNFKNGNIVAVTDASTDFFSWMINSNISESSSGNGIMFKVEVKSENSIYLHEFVASPENNICCRHIHHINRVRDGWIIGTGEIYPNSWILYIQMKEADTFAEKCASCNFDIYRLNSSEKSVQRTLGLIWNDDKNNTIIYASDHDVLDGKEKISPVPERSISFSRNATGIYSGKLEDIDDYNKFLPIFEAKEPAYLFQKIGQAIVYSGQRGELAISFDNGSTWNESHIDGALNHYKGGTYQYHIFDDYLLRIK